MAREFSHDRDPTPTGDGVSLQPVEASPGGSFLGVFRFVAW